MITEIGIIAGEIWKHLDEKGNVSVDQLVELTNTDRELILMSLGWLAREGHVSLNPIDGRIVITLHQKV